MAGHGGARQGAGRKSKAEEQSLIERLSPLSDEAYKALKNAVKKQQPWAVKLYFEYMYGKPRQSTDITTNGDSITMPTINFTKGEN